MKNWCKTKLGHFLITSCCVTALVACFSFLSHAKQLIHIMWVFLGAITLFPILIVAAMVGIPIVFGIFAIFSGECDDVGSIFSDGFDFDFELAESAIESQRSIKKWVASYYRFFANVEHPVFWGFAVGLIGGLSLLSLLVLPRIAEKESLTVQRMRLIERELQNHLLASNAFPDPTPQGTLILRHPDLTTDEQGQLVDGFGNPFVYKKRVLDTETFVEEQSASEAGLLNKAEHLYRKHQRKKILEEAQSENPNQEASSYNLVSQGYNISNSDDDFCVRGKSAVLGTLMDKSKGSIQIKGFSFGSDLKQINELRCR